jgi:D-serine deaminase-like pyridoxal phosphate-dependent protein
MDKIGALNNKITGLQIVADHSEQIKMLAAIATKEHPIHVLIDIDPEFGRTGVAFKDALEFGKYIAQFPNIILDGVQCYAGHLQHITSGAERNQASTRLMKMGAEVFNNLRNLYPTCKIFTGTGTGTSAADLLIEEITDIQVGSYCMMDSEYLAVEHTGPHYEPALRMISSAISCHHPGHATIDAGTKSIYVTPGAPARVINNNTIDERFAYDWNFGDEHGHLVFDPEVKVALGERFELIVSHCDPTVNLFDELWITKGNEVIDRWEISLRGCCR